MHEVVYSVFSHTPGSPLIWLKCLFYRYSKRDREARDAENSAQKLQKENNDLLARTSDAEAARKALDTEVNVRKICTLKGTIHVYNNNK